MANDLTKQPWIIDTAAATVLTNDRIRVKAVHWVGATTAGHQAIVQDPASRELFRADASGVNNVDRLLFEADWRLGFKVPTLDSGKLYIYIE